jgi:SAM-dependent methyltransferase
MSFSASWLALREPADHRARDCALADRLALHLAQHSTARLLDLGCGSGSNLRALAPVLGQSQDWTLVDYDAALLAAARDALMAWADQADASKDALVLAKQGKAIRVQFQQADLSQGLQPLLASKPHCVTASALFDLCSADFIAQATHAIAQCGAAFYTVLTYDGVERWHPSHARDEAVLAAFIAHQKTDKGFGISAGPDAPDALAHGFQREGYEVFEASTPWQLEAPRDNMLMAELARGIAAAARETGQVEPILVDDWLAARLAATHAAIGHRDLLALPR